MTRFLSVDETASFLGIRKSYLYKLVHERRVPCYKPLGGKILFDADELDAFVRAGRVATHEELEVKAVELLNSRGSR